MNLHYYKNTEFKKDHVLGRAVCVLEAAVHHAKNHPLMFGGGCSGILFWAGANTLLLRLSLNPAGPVPAAFIFGVSLISGFAVWKTTAQGLMQRFGMEWTLGLRDANLFLLPLNVFAVFLIPVRFLEAPHWYIGLNLISLGMTGVLMLAYAMRIAPKKQPDYVIPADLPADPAQETPWPNDAKARKLHVDGETRNGMILKAGDSRIFSIRSPQANIRFAFAASQNIRRRQYQGCLKVLAQAGGKPPELIYAKHIDVRGDFMTRQWTEVSLGLDEKWLKAELRLTVSLDQNALKNDAEVYLSEIRSLAVSSKAKKVILVFFDGLRHDFVGPRPDGTSLTPNLDALKRDAVSFQNAFTQGNWTLTSFMSTLSGTFPSRHQVYHPRKIQSLPPSMTTVPQLFRERGYRTQGLFTHRRLVSHYGFTKGFDVHDCRQCDKETGAGTAGEITFKAMDILEANKANPLFLMIHYFDTHAPYYPSTAYAGVRDPLYAEPGVPSTHEMIRSKDKVRALENMFERYSSEIQKADMRFGCLVDYLKRSGQYDSACLVVTADHGTRLNNPDRITEYDLSDESIQVPLIVKMADPDKGMAGHDNSEDFVQVNTDIGATILEASGILPAAGMQGKSLPVSNRSGSGRDCAISEAIYNREYMASIRDQEYRYVITQALRGDDISLDGLQWSGWRENLYPVERGQNTSQDIAVTHPDVCKRYRDRILSHFENSRKGHGAASPEKAAA
jgi:arylsulfatase A-like enzyme